MRQVVKATLFICIGVWLFMYIQTVFIPAAVTEQDLVNHVIHGVRALDEDTVDVLFAGTSSVELGMSPMKLYEDFGYCSYSVASIYQPIEVSYFMLKYALKTQSPAVIMLDVGNLFMEDNVERSKQFRIVMDNYPLSSSKLEMAESYGELTFGNGYLSAVFPIVEYHDRWTNLNEADFFNTWEVKDYYSLGQELKTGVEGTGSATFEDINLYAELLHSRKRIKTIENGKLSTREILTSTYVPQISERNVDYFEKILSLCKENDIELVLFKVPNLLYPQYFSSAWTRQRSNITKEFAIKYGVPFLDLVYDNQINLDWNADTYDGGNHLNVLGSEKVADAIGQYLSENYALPSKQNLQYDGYRHLYNKVRMICGLEMEQDFASYLDYLKENLSNWTILVAASDEYTQGLDEASYDTLRALGLQLVQDGEKCDAYMAVIDRGELKYEAVSNSRIDYSKTIDGLSINMSSSGWNTASDCAIKINGRSYDVGNRGLNFVIYDRETGLVIDSVCFDTCVSKKTVSRNTSLTHSYLRAYEAKICFGEGAA